AQVDLGDPARVSQQDLDLALGLRPPEPGLHRKRTARHAVGVEQPAPADVEKVGLAVVAEGELLAELEALDRRVAAYARALPAAEQEHEWSQVRMRLRRALRHRVTPGPGSPHRAGPGGSPGKAAGRQSPPPPRPRRTRQLPALR